MTTIDIKQSGLVYNTENKTFYGSEKKVKPFDTSYALLNKNTGVSVVFDFTHSTGPEFDPKTAWVYKSKEGYFLNVSNDPAITAVQAAAYLHHKLNRD